MRDVLPYQSCNSTIILLCLFLTPILFSGCNNSDHTTALGTLERDLIRLSATSSQLITDIYVTEGEDVAPGTALLQLDATTAAAELARAEARVSGARAYLQQMLNGARTEEVAAAQAQVDNAMASAQEATKAFQRSSTLVRQKLVGQAELDSARARRDSAAATLHAAREQLTLLVKGTRPEQIEQAQAQLQEAEQALNIAQKNLSDLRIVATRQARIDSLPWHQGERVAAGAVVVVMLANETPYVRAYVPESVRASLAIGQQLTVQIDGVDQSFTGTLSHIQQAPAFTPHYALTETERSRLMYLAEVQLGDEARDLPSGIPAQVLIPTAGSQ